MTISIVLADDHVMVRQGLRVLIEAEKDLSVVGEAEDGLETLKLVERLKPNVLVLDVMMPGLNGLEALAIIRQRIPDTQVVILSMYPNEAFVVEALKQGALGYVLKCCKSIHLLKAIREAASGRRHLSPPMSEHSIEVYLEKAKSATMDPHDTLTPREREVLQLTAEGHSQPEIAKRLHISPRTVEMHRKNLMRKLGLRNQADLIRYAIDRRLLPDQK